MIQRCNFQSSDFRVVEKMDAKGFFFKNPHVSCFGHLGNSLFHSVVRHPIVKNC